MNAARNDAIKRREVAADVERETRHRDPIANAHANGRDLAIFNPDAGQTRTRLRCDFVDRERFDQKLFQPAQIAVEILPAPAQINNWITNQLAGTVIGRLATAVDGKKRMRQMSCVDQARLIRRSADRVNRFVLEKKELVGGVAILPLFRDQFLLPRERFLKIQAAEPTPRKCL